MSPNGLLRHFTISCSQSPEMPKKPPVFAPVATFFIHLAQQLVRSLPGFGTIGFFHQEDTSEEMLVEHVEAVPAGSTNCREHDAVAADDTESPKNKRHLRLQQLHQKNLQQLQLNTLHSYPTFGLVQQISIQHSLGTHFRLSHSTIRCSVRTYGLL